MAIIELSDVTMTYGRGPAAPPGDAQRRAARKDERRAALREVSVAVEEGAFAVLMGPSGAGKSTLLKLVLAMERPDEGTIRVAGRDIHRLRRSSIPYLRRNVGAVFQDFKLLSDASPLENVALALQVLGMPPGEVRRRAASALSQVELDPDAHRPARCLSGGEQQRVAIARALAGEPAILLADEPTGNLDPRLTREILDLLARVRERGTTVLLATHDPLVLDHPALTQQIHLEHGRLVSLHQATRAYGRCEDEDGIPAILPAAWPEPAGAVA
ncbi:cell division ATP-binding protein FtsE [Paraliomyxa miuraensis]|uniref:cell division ATP-binding protein FtsE n=1 Tax=Paraliomyxa miuraensis TaxID=376150 RepID=UPI002257121B|nr:ATP-binding cassette domain-containing protein [Paraliomyxa miuraensis]MCX4241641.1 ATP-binding cassette domain-containing protein [Paraliomyxa miuraensis]